MTGEAGVAKGMEGGHFSGGVGQNLQSILSVENDLVQSCGAGVAEGIVERLRFLGRELLKKKSLGNIIFSQLEHPKFESFRGSIPPEQSWTHIRI